MDHATLTTIGCALLVAASILAAVRSTMRPGPKDFDWSIFDDADGAVLLSRPDHGYDTAEARARRVAALSAERAALEVTADQGRDRREARDARRRRFLDIERIKYGLTHRTRHIDDMVA